MIWRIPTHKPSDRDHAQGTEQRTRSRYIDSIALATPFSYASSVSQYIYITHLSDHFPNNLGFRNLLLVRRSFLQCFCQCFGCELAYCRTNIQRLDTLRPKGLIAKERLYDCRLFKA